MSRAGRVTRPAARSHGRLGRFAWRSAWGALAMAGGLAVPMSVTAGQMPSRSPSWFDPIGAVERSGVGVCVAEEHRWSGSLDLAARGATAMTDVEVPAEVGTWLRVTGVSADGLDANGFVHAVEVTVGASTAVAGATVDPGVVGVRALDDMPVTVSGITLVIERCHEVASAAAPAVEPAEVPANGVAGDRGSGGRGPGLVAAVAAVCGALAVVGALSLRAVARRRHC